MIEQAKELATHIKELKEQASSLLEEAVETGDLLTAWGVFEALEKYLPMKDYIIRETEYPLLRKDIDSYDYFNRYQEVRFVDYLEEQIWFIENPEEVIPDYITSFDRSSAEAMMWEVLKNGYAGFNYDW